MDPTLIIAAIQAGVAIFKNASGALSAKTQSYVDAGSSIISAAVGLYTEVKDTLSISDTATIDAAVEEAHAKCGADLARVLAELDAAAKT